MPTQEETDPGAEGWSLLGLVLDDGEFAVLPDAIALFDEALEREATVDHPCWHYGRGLARSLLAGQSDDAAAWGPALDDLWSAWDAAPHPDVSREALADDLAHALVNRAMAQAEDTTIDELNTGFDRLALTDVATVAMAVGQGLARLQRYHLSGAGTDHDEGMALLRAALPDAPDDLLALGPALYAFALAAAIDDEVEEALTALDRFRALLTSDDPDEELDGFEADLLYAAARCTDSPAAQDAALARLERLCAASDRPPLEGLIGAAELHLLRTIEGLAGDEPGPDFDAAIRWLDQAETVVDGDGHAMCRFLLGMAHNRRAKLSKDAAEREYAIACLDAALALGLPDPDLTLSAHHERLDAYNTDRDENAVVIPAGMEEAFAAGLAALDAHADAAVPRRAELAMELISADMTLSSLRMDLPDVDRIQRHIDIAASHPDPPTEWTAMLAVARAAVQGADHVFGGGSGNAGVAVLVEALKGTRRPDVTGDALRRLISLQSFIGHGGALHSIASASAFFQSPDAGPMERFMAAMADFILCQQQSGDQAQIIATVDAAIDAAGKVDPETWDGRLVNDDFLPSLQAVRQIGRADGSPLPDLPALSVPGSHARQARAATEIMRAAVTIANAPPDQPWAGGALDALEQQVEELPEGVIRGVGVGTLLVLWRHRAERLRDPASAERALTWADEALQFAPGPEHPLYVQTLDETARAHRMLGRAEDLRRGRELRLAALRGQAWSVLLQSGTEHAHGRAHKAAADAVELARWCVADRAPDDLVAALDAGRGLVLQAAVATRGIAEQLTAIGADDLAAEWADAGGDDAVTHSMVADLGLHTDLRRRVLRTLTAAGAGIAAATSVDAVRAALRNQGADALIYLVPADPAGHGLAVVVPVLAPVEVIELPALDAQQATELARDVTGVAGRDLCPSTAGSHEPAALMEWAWQSAGAELAAIADRLRPAPDRLPRLVLVPFGPLALVPWHAAMAAGSAATGLLERAVVSYIPSAHLLSRATGRPRVPGGAALVVGNPTGDLPQAGAEARALVEAFYPAATYLGRSAGESPEPSGVGAAAEVLAVLGAEARPLALLHLACHAHAHPTEPWRSSLQLADRPVDVDELLDVRRSRALDIDTVCLAGCSTNVAGAAHDEAFSLASAFLAAGARTAYGSMWTVPDDHTSRLMFMVHHFRAREGCDPAEALRRAQRWAADAQRVPPPTMPAALARGAVGPVDPLGWAGFQHLGA